MDANQPREQWFLGRIVGVNGDDKGIVRSGEVKTMHGVHRRQITSHMMRRRDRVSLLDCGECYDTEMRYV